jgi:hypothetical protein
MVFISVNATRCVEKFDNLAKIESHLQYFAGGSLIQSGQIVFLNSKVLFYPKPARKIFCNVNWGCYLDEPPAFYDSAAV